MKIEMIFINKNSQGKKFFLTSKWGKVPTECDLNYQNEEIYLVFGKESKGLPEDLIKLNKKSCIRLPMSDKVKCLNLSNTVAVIVYEAKRQNNYFGLK